jgi:hypothetical protein
VLSPEPIYDPFSLGAKMPKVGNPERGFRTVAVSNEASQGPVKTNRGQGVDERVDYLDARNGLLEHFIR